MQDSCLRPRTGFWALLLALLLVAHAVRAKDPPLPAYNADPAQSSISGISSGAYMAVQFATAWSSVIHGVGAVAGGPYGCAEGSVATALSTCMLGVPATDLQSLLRRTEGWSRSGAIDPLANLARQHVYLFSGYNDAVVARSVTDTLRDFYAHYLGADHRANLFYQTAIGAGHAQVTTSFGARCADNGGSFINRCDYDQAGIILQHIYGALHPPGAGLPHGAILRFAQAAFTKPASPADDSLGDTGFAYVPQDCAAMQACRVHIALHGCKQSYGDIGEAYVLHAGYNAWADANRIIVLYPQARAEAFTPEGGSNPEGCWDWWGYLDAAPMDAPAYLLKSGRQIGAIKAMLDRLTSRAADAIPAAAAMAATAPEMFGAIDASDHAIDLAWSVVPGASRYDVFRAAPADADFRRIGSTDGLSYADPGLQPETTYRYRVRVSSATPGPFSATVTRTTRPPVPHCVEPGTCR